MLTTVALIYWWASLIPRLDGHGAISRRDSPVKTRPPITLRVVNMVRDDKHSIDNKTVPFARAEQDK